MTRAQRARSTVVAMGAALTVALAALLLSAATALADTASNPPPAEPTNNLLLGIVAIAVLSGIVVLMRPRRGPR